MTENMKAIFIKVHRKQDGYALMFQCIMMGSEDCLFLKESLRGEPLGRGREVVAACGFKSSIEIGIEHLNFEDMKGQLFCLLLVCAIMAQTDFKNTCQNASLIPKLATGLIYLNPLDTYNNGANKDYYKDISLAGFASIDVLGYGFSLTGFQTSCGNSFYTLIIDKVMFQNQNTRMRIVANFRNPADGTITRWDIVSFTYIIVSRNLNGAYSDIWATVAETVTPPHNSPIAIDLVGAPFRNAAVGACTVYTDPNYVFTSGSCVPTTPATAGGLGGGQVVIHTYIMGFMFNPAKTTAHYLYAGVLKQFPGTPSDPITTTVNLAASPYGPVLSYFNPNGAMEYIKIAIVLSRFDSGVVTPGNTYPSGSLLLYTSSYIYTPVTSFNVSVPVQRGTGAAFNQRYYHLPDARYAIYGVTSFDLPQNTNTSCSTIIVNGTLNSVDTFTVMTPNSNPTNFFFEADIFTVNLDMLCNSNSVIQLQTQMNIVGQKSLFTVPTMSLQQYILEDSSAPITVPGGVGSGASFNFEYYGANNGNNDTILFQTSIPFIGLTVGAPLKFEFGYFDTIPALNGNAAAKMISGTTYHIQLAVNGFILYENAFVAGASGSNTVIKIIKGLNSNSTTANAVITISYVRSINQDQNFWTYLRLYQYTNAYDPTTGCCPTSCPPNTGLDVQNNPPVCVYCNTQGGLVYNPNNGTCTCVSGFYLDSTKTFQCYPCSALYCSICNPLNPSQCTTCVTGAVLDNVTLTCSCGSGFFVNGTTCQKCTHECQNCSSPTGACTACVDPLHRDISQNCKCISGFYDSGAVNCSVCSTICLTCTNSSACTSCDTSKFRNLTGALCSCMDGYYELYNTNLTRTCEKCNPECKTCTTSPTLCTSCDPAKNRVSGVDNSGRQTCLCQPGYYSTPDGSCIQSNCNADPFCSDCEQGLQLCIKCLASKFRVIKLPESVCVCMDGYYANSNNTCVPCLSGCSICSSATNCSSCVALSTPKSDGSCSCPNQTYFAVSSEGVRYCAACGYKCSQCVDAQTCTTCLPSYTKTADNKCVCSPRYFVDPRGDCLPCANGCQNCSSAANLCNSCITPLLLQGSFCQTKCNDGYTQVGTVCVGCSEGCLRCTENLICYYCADNYYMYNGNCYKVCPAGTIGSQSSGNWVCVPCNEPCKTCINHPSYCTSCINGQGYLQISANAQSCVLTCVDGTYASEGVCQVCDFRCATCLGSATNCISCPAGQILYKGGCWAACPAIQLQAVGQNASCVDQCPAGFYKYSLSECSPCAIECTTCEGGPKNCTSCLHGSVSINGSCSVTCGENEFSFQGICVACSDSCYGCQYNPQNCLNCASGYVKTGSICQKGCLSYQFYDNNQRKCISCGPGCSTCSSYNYCTSCQNSAITPRGGVCSNCPYPCSTCDGSGACTSCLSGFYFFQGSCQTSCPAGASPVNSICQCASGIVSNGQCVTSCGSGFTSIGGSCQPCNPNCAECSGSVNSCTRCISGFTIDVTANKCVSQAVCPYGQDTTGGVCMSICDPGFYFYEGICIYGGCFDGYSPNAYGGCVRQSQPITSGPNCNSNQFISNGQCVGSCLDGYYPDYSTRQCKACSSNCISCFSNSFCIICKDKYQVSDGVCALQSSCPSGQYIYKSGCVLTCPIGTYVDGGKCVRICGDGTYFMSQMCYISCPTGIRTPDACVSDCPTGTTNQNGICL